MENPETYAAEKRNRSATSNGATSLAFGVRLLAAIGFLSLVSSPIMAQENGPPELPEQAQNGHSLSCQILENSRRPNPSSDENYLLAACGDIGINLGVVESYRTFRNVPDDLLIVEVVRAGRVQVYLLSSDSSGSPLVENLTSAIAVAAGRTATSRIDNLVLDFDGLPASGVVRIAGERWTDPAGDTILGALDRQVSARAIASQARARRAGHPPAGAPSTNGGVE